MKGTIRGLLIFVIMISFLFAGCVTFKVKDDQCMRVEASDSIICMGLAKMNISARDANLLFKFANLEMIKTGVYSKEDALKLFNHIEKVINIMTYQQLAEYLILTTKSINADYSMEMILVSEYFSMFEEIPIPISEFDKYLLKGHIQEQRRLVLMVN